MMARMDGSVVWRAALLQALTLGGGGVDLSASSGPGVLPVVGLARRAGRLGAVRAVHRRGAAAARCCRCSPAPRWPGCRAWSACCSTSTGWARRSAWRIFAAWCGRLARTRRDLAVVLMDLGLEGKVALVTAGSKGIGRGIAEALAAEGAKVAVTSRSTERAEAGRGRDRRLRLRVRLRRPRRRPGAARSRRERPRADRHLRRQHRRPARRATRCRFTREQWEAAQRTLLISPMAIIERVAARDARARLRPRRRDRLDGGAPSRSTRCSSPTPTGPGLVAAFKVLARQHAARRRHVQPRAPGPDRDRPHDRHRRLARGGPGAGARDGPGGAARHASRSSPRRPSSCARDRPRTSTERPCSSTAD